MTETIQELFKRAEHELEKGIITKEQYGEILAFLYDKTDGKKHSEICPTCGSREGYSQG